MSYSNSPPSRWGKEAAGVSMTSFHALRDDNPHHTTAAQVGAYSKTETDTKIASAVAPLATGTALAEIADQVSENVSEIAEILGKIAAIEYVEPTISSVTLTPSSAEIGAALTSVTITVNRNRLNLPVIIGGAAQGVIPAGATSVALSGAFQSPDKVFTATVTDPAAPPGRVSTASASGVLRFQSARYWGVSQKPALEGADLNSLTKDLGTSLGPKTVTYNATGGRYVYYAYPAVWGTPTSVLVNGLAFSAFSATDVDHSNSQGVVATYRVLRLNNIQNGEAITIVWQ